MGLMNWLMKGIGFEGEEEQTPDYGAEALASEKQRAKELKKQEKMARKIERQRVKNERAKKSVEPEPEEQEFVPRQQISETSFTKEEQTVQTMDSGFSGQSYGGYDNQSYGQAPMNTYGNKNIVFFYPKSYGEVKQLIDYLKQGESVMLNLDGIGDDEAQRMLDFSSGAVYALNGSIKRVSGNIFLLTPEGLGIISNQTRQ